MNSIQDVFDDHRMEYVSDLVVFRCMRDSDAYRRNRNWLKRGWAGWWKVARSPDGIVNLIDSEDGNHVEVWAAPGAKKLKEDAGGRWVLEASTPFFKLGTTPAAGRKFMGKILTQDGPTYVIRANGKFHPDGEFLQQLKIIERRRFQLHFRAERNSSTSRRVKEIQGCVCKACDADLEAVFGKWGQSCIEAHHLYPLSKLKINETREYDLKNSFAVLCANCHRMIHRMEDPSDLKAFRKFVKSRAR
jgi:hypothetical protein